MYFLCIAIWQLLVQQRSNMQNLAKSYPKNHIKDTCNTDSEMEKKLTRRVLSTAGITGTEYCRVVRGSGKLYIPMVCMCLFYRVPINLSTEKEGTGFQRTQILYPMKWLFLRSINTFAMLWKHNHFPNFRKAGLFFFPCRYVVCQR